MRKAISIGLSVLIVLALILAAIPLLSSEKEVSYSIVKKKIGNTDLEAEFEDELHIYLGDNRSFNINFFNHNDMLRYAVNMDLKGGEEVIKRTVLKMATVVTVNPKDNAPFIFWIEPTKTGEYELTLDISTSYFGSLPLIEDLIYALPALGGALIPVLHGVPAAVPWLLDTTLYLPKVLPWVIIDALDALLKLKPLFDDSAPSLYKHFDFVGNLVVTLILNWIPHLPEDLLHWIEILPWALTETARRWIENLPTALSEWWPTTFKGMSELYPSYAEKIEKLRPTGKELLLSFGYYIPEDIAGILESFATSEYWHGPQWLKNLMQKCANRLWETAGEMHGAAPEKLSGSTSYVIKVKVTEKPLTVRIFEGFDRWISGFTSFFSYKWTPH
jgi:hypothetical protein